MTEELKNTLYNVAEMEAGTLDGLADLFKTFGDATRLRILSSLSRSELCVNELADSLEMTQSAISHQLRILKNNRLVKSRRDGKLIYYSLDDEHVRLILSQGMEHILEH